jgi:hypothetical protein
MTVQPILLGSGLLCWVLYFVHKEKLQSVNLELSRDIRNDQKLEKYTLHYWISACLFTLALALTVFSFLPGGRGSGSIPRIRLSI